MTSPPEAGSRGGPWIRDRGLFIVLRSTPTQYEAEKATDSSLGASLTRRGDNVKDVSRSATSRVRSAAVEVTKLLRNCTSLPNWSDHNKRRKTNETSYQIRIYRLFRSDFLAAEFEGCHIQVQVGAGGARFTPQNVTINVGDTVEWTWAGPNHSTTSGTPGNPDGLWDSGVHGIGFVFSRVFTTPGTFNYFCSPHGLCCGISDRSP